MMTLEDIFLFISQADDAQLNDITTALSARYKVLFPDWDVLYLALPLHDAERREELWAQARKAHP